MICTIRLELVIVVTMVTAMLSCCDGFSFHEPKVVSRLYQLRVLQPRRLRDSSLFLSQKFKYTTNHYSYKKLNPLFQSSRGIDNNESTSIKTNNEKSSSLSNLREKLLQVSNIASMLCVIDCTVLPIVTVLLPLIGLGASPAQAKWLHELGHSVALFFVLPVGGLAATMNYLSSKNSFLFAIAGLGLSMIYAANGHGGPILSLLPHGLAHSLHCGTLLHRSVNIIGCACLLSSNYYAHRLTCNHDHGGSSSIGSCCGHYHHGIDGLHSDKSDSCHSHDNSHDNSHDHHNERS